MRALRILVTGLTLLGGAILPAAAGAYSPPPPDAGFDYQIGGDYPLPAGVSVVSRDWFSGRPAGGAYSICYVNAFQTQANERGTDRPDERSNWPRGLVLRRLGDDPHWGGEYLIDIGSAKKRRRASRWVAQMIRSCADSGYDAVEFDNLDSWTRFNGTPLAPRVPFGKRQALAYARLLAARSHALDLAVGQKNTAGITRAESDRVGFDFAIAEECGRYHECGRYRRVYGDEVVAIEYRRRDFRSSCRAVGDRIAVVLRDRLVSTPAKRRYVFEAC
ncbi:MAG: endo alpha-1,4 polygalactosaminidase [Solirubrobacterales bacterium]|nr:endo alpha-1,4 polygalactosaminidase [Solirubrobacterales bacterium]